MIYNFNAPGAWPITRISTTTYTVLKTDLIVQLSNTGARTITLPNPGSCLGQFFFIKDEAGNAGTNHITINVNGAAGELIDGSSSITISTNYGWVILYAYIIPSVTVNWSVFGK